MSTSEVIRELTKIPGVGKSIATDLYNIGIRQIDDLKGRDPQELYDTSNDLVGCIQDKCLLYTFRCALYFSETPEDEKDSDKLNGGIG